MSGRTSNGRPSGSSAADHERARTLLAERLDERPEAADLIWLEHHLADCADCREVDSAYRSDRAALRAMLAPEPPRDLWARTSAALEAESRSARPRTTPGGTAGRRRPLLTPRGSLGLVAAVVGVLVVGSLLQQQAGGPSVALGSPSTTLGASGLPGLATPIVVQGGDVAWSVRAPDGTYTLQEAAVDQVCPTGASSGCTPLDSHSAGVADIPVTPKSVYASSAMHQVVVLGRQPGSNDLGLYVVPVAGSASSASPSPSVRPAGSPGASSSSSPAGSSAVPPSASPSAAAGSAAPTPGASGSAVPSTPASPPASPGTPSASPSGSGPAVSPSASVPAPGTPAPTAAAVLAIASDLTVLGDTASYSPDGTWFAFTARDSGATGGSDIYVWRLGRTMATPVTADHRSVFAGWDDDRIVGSRAAPTADGDSPRPSSEASPSDKTTDDDAVSFLLDPATLAATPLAVPAWRPVVDPTGGYALYWQGTVVPDGAGGWTTGTGRLVLAPWDEMTATSQTVAPIELPADVASAAGVGWQARWDETGSHLAIWTADRSDPTLGHLDFLTVDRKTGLADPTGPSLRDRPALAGFALENGHLAWATPPGQDGQGSTLQVYAWSGPHAGQISSQAADGSDPVIVVQH